MALSRIVAFGDGSTTQFAIPFALGYIRRSDITCRVGTEQDGAGNPIYRTLTWISDELVDVALPVVANGVRIEFTRTTSRDTLLVDYEDGDIINEENMNIAQKQALMLVHETLDGRFEQFQSDFDLGGFRITRLGEPIALTDAATKNYVDSRISTGAASAAAASASAAAALASANASAASAGVAAGHASTANAASATAVAAAASTAGSVSAAATSASNAATSASEALGYRNTASTHATTATTKAGEAVASAAAAATSATNAATSATASDTARGAAVVAQNASVAAKDLAVSANGTAQTASSTATTKAAEAAASAASMKQWRGTQAEYDAIIAKDPEVLYFIV